MYHYFDVDIALKYGLNEAILLNNISFWVMKNEANEQNFFEGKYWTYNSAKAFSKLFPYMSARTIQRVLKNLVDEGLILVNKFSDDPMKRTNYYTLTDLAKSITTNCDNPLRQVVSIDNDNMTQSILNKNTDSTDINNTDINIQIPLISPRENLFDMFWAAYPQCFRKTNRKGCKAKFIKIKDLENIFPDIISSLEMQKRSKQWNEQDGQFIPAPLTWINQERWTVQDTRTERQAAADNILQSSLNDFL